MNVMVEQTLHSSKDGPTALAQLIDVAKHILEQAIQFVDGLVSDEQLTTESVYLPGSTIGKHLRHAREHYTLLLECIAAAPPRVLNYDVRTRNTPMESSRRGVIDALRETVARIEMLDTKMDEPLTLHAITPHPQVMQTTFGRELWFCELHAIHHWSMIRVIAGELKVEMKDASFGFAPSTLVFKRNEGTLGKAKY